VYEEVTWEKRKKLPPPSIGYGVKQSRVENFDTLHSQMALGGLFVPSFRVDNIPFLVQSLNLLQGSPRFFESPTPVSSANFEPCG